MITLRPKTFRISDRSSPVFGVLLRPNSISGVRYASLTSAIERGKRRSAAVEERRGSSFGGRRQNSWEERGKRPSRTPPKESTSSSSRQWDQSPPRARSQGPEFQLDEDEFIKTGRMRKKEERHQKKETIRQAEYIQASIMLKEGEKDRSWERHLARAANPLKGKRGRNHHRYSDEFPERVKPEVQVPSAIPYTTAASVFIYGTSAVEAALRCSRRKLYKLYIYQGEGQELTTQQNLIRKMALAQGVTVKMAFAGWELMMTKMSEGRPHNGFVLEASPLPTLPVANLEPVTDPTANVFHVKVNPQSKEEAKVNGSSNKVQRAERYDEISKSRFPLLLLVDGIVDPGNIGAIIRSAYYLGVDAIVYAGRNSAPMSPVTAKASAGATESMTFLRTVNPQEFVQASRKNGWRFLAADSPRNVFERSRGVTSVDRAAGTNTSSLLTEAPTVLMLGNEGTGLMERLKVRADGLISIPGARFLHEQGIKDAAGVDSLNVSVAAAMLMEMLMRTPLQVTDLPGIRKQENETPPLSEAQEAEAQEEAPQEEAPKKEAPQSFDFN